MIMKGRAPLRLPSAGLLTLVVMAVATLPAWATGTQQAQAAQAAQPVQATQVRPEPQAQQGQAKPAPAATAAKPSPQTPATTQTVRATQVHTPTPATTHTVRVTEPTQTAAAVHAQPSQRRTVAVSPPVRDEKVHVQEARQVVVAGSPQARRFSFFAAPSSLTDEGQKLVMGFEADREAIQKEADAKLQARREAIIKELQVLQDQYAKAGKLDEAVAIRDYLKAGGPGNPKVSWVIRRCP